MSPKWNHTELHQSAARTKKKMSPKNSTYHCTTSQPTLLQFIQPCLNQIHIINMLPATSTQSMTLTLMQNPTPTPNNPTPATFPPPPQQQPPIMPPTENVAWGNINQYERPMDHFRVISKNVSTINIYLLDMLAIATELKKLKLVFFGPGNQYCIESSHHPSHSNIRSSSVHPYGPCYLGWAKTLQTCNTKLAVHWPWFSVNGCHVLTWGSNKLLGWWSYVKLVSQHDKRIIVASAYCVGLQTFDVTSNTVTAQQTRLLQQQGITNLNPRWQFMIHNLINQEQ